MTGISRVASAAVIVLAGAAPAFAQTLSARTGLLGRVGSASSTTRDLYSTQTVRNPNQKPAFQVLGVPVVISAPVAPPYGATDEYSTYAGQPGGGPNAILAESVGATP